MRTNMNFWTKFNKTKAIEQQENEFDKKSIYTHDVYVNNFMILRGLVEWFNAKHVGRTKQTHIQHQLATSGNIPNKGNEPTNEKPLSIPNYYYCNIEMIEMENTQTTSYQIKIYPKKHTQGEHQYVYMYRWAYVELKRLLVAIW